MMISNFRKSLCRDESGQAIILGAVSLLVLAVGIMTTIQLGWTIKERIQLQHAADNAAYTQAVMVARSLNFIAWTNRAIIAHYVTMMNLQSMISWMDANATVLALNASMLNSIGFVLGVAAKIPILAWLDPIARLVGTAGDGFKKAAEYVRDFSNGLDKVLPGAIRFLSFINKGYYGLLQKSIGKGVLKGLFWGGMLGANGPFSQAVEGTANQVEDNVVYDELLNILYVEPTGLLGTNVFEKLFDEEGSEKISSNSATPDTKRALGLMTGLVNASREGKGNIKFETGREDLVTSLIGDLGGWAKKIYEVFAPSSDGAALMADPIQQDKLEDALNNLKNKGSQTERHKGNPLFSHTVYESAVSSEYLAQGRALITTDYIGTLADELPGFLQTVLKWISTGGIELVPVPRTVGIQATEKSNLQKHCRFQKFDTVVDKACGAIKGAIEKASDACKNNCKETCILCKEKCDNEGNCSRPNSCDMSECESSKWEAKNSSDAIPSYDENGQETGSDSCNSCGEKENEQSDLSTTGKDGTDLCDQIGEQAYNAIKEIFGAAPVTATVDCEDCGNNHAFDGITKFVSFNMKSFEKEKDYPYFWGLVQKAPSFKNSILGGKDILGFGDSDFAMTDSGKDLVGIIEGPTSKFGSSQKKCDVDDFKCIQERKYNFNHMKERDFFGMGEGMHAWATAQVYYHRPGAWAEPPNLFNPYWGAKLSPVSKPITKLTDQIPFLGDLLSDGVEVILSH